MIDNQKILDAMDNLMLACGAPALQPMFQGLPDEFIGKLNSIVTAVLPKHLQAMQNEVQQIITREMSSLNK